METPRDGAGGRSERVGRHQASVIVGAQSFVRLHRRQSGGDSTVSHKAVNRKSAPRWRSPAAILGIVATAVAAKFQSQTSKVPQYCDRRRVDPKGAGEVTRNPPSGNVGALDGTPPVALSQASGEDQYVVEKRGDPSEASTICPSAPSGVSGDTGRLFPAAVAVPVPSFPSLSIRAHSSPSLSVQCPPGNSSSDTHCSQLPGPVDAQGHFCRMGRLFAGRLYSSVERSRVHGVCS